MSEFFDALEKAKHTSEIIGSNILPEGDILEKAKYLRRFGTPGNYKYVYEEKKMRTVKSSMTEKQYKLKSSTEEYFTSIENGKVVWDKKREKNVHSPIIERYLSKAVPQKSPTVYLMMGAPGSGKGTVLEYLQTENLIPKEMTVADPDEIKTKKENLGSDYEQYWKYHKDSASSLVHEEGSYITNKIIKDYRRLKSNLVIDKTFTNYYSLRKTVKKFLSSGYNVKVVMAYQTQERGFKNIQERFERTGRGVNEKYAKQSYESIGPTSQKFIKNLPEGVSFEQWHVEEYGKPPVKLYSKSGKREEGKMKS